MVASCFNDTLRSQKELNGVTAPAHAGALITIVTCLNGWQVTVYRQLVARSQAVQQRAACCVCCALCLCKQLGSTSSSTISNSTFIALHIACTLALPLPLQEWLQQAPQQAAVGANACVGGAAACRAP
jgi:hypothetical protein